MKNYIAKPIFIVFFFLIAQMSYAQVPTRTPTGIPKIPSKQQVAKPVNKDLEKAQANLANAKKTYFKKLTVGNPTQKEGKRTLTAVDDSFLETSETKVSNIKGGKTATGFCTTQKIDVHIKSRNFNEFPSEGAPDWLKPGVVMKGQDFIIGNGKMEERYERSPIVLQTDLKGVSKTFIEVSNPKNRHLINQAVHDLTSQSAQPVNANMYFKFYEVNSLEELGLKVNGKFSAAFGAIGGSLGLSYGSKKSSYYYVMEFNQHMFNISLNSIDANNLFKDRAIPTDDYIYISRVNYGRRGLIIFKSNKTLKEYNIQAAATTKAVVLNATLKTAFNQLQEDSEVEMKLFFYGGTPESAIKSIEKSLEERKPGLLDFIKGSPSNHLIALPIGYDIKNLDNQIVGLENNYLQPGYETCVTYPVKTPKKELKLKVTLLDLQCIEGRDGGGNEADDYAIQQYIKYTANGKPKEAISRSFNTFPDRQNAPVQEAGQKNILISGDATHQLHIKQNRNKANRGNTINNSLVFSISEEDLADNNAEFKIYTWLKEYSSTDRVIHNINKPASVRINDVIEILLTPSLLDPKTRFPDGQIGQATNEAGLYHSFGSEYLMVDNIQKLSKRFILEGPIKLGNAGEKAAAWISFELIE